MARPISTRPTIKLCHSNRNGDMVEKLLETDAFQSISKLGCAEQLFHANGAVAKGRWVRNNRWAPSGREPRGAGPAPRRWSRHGRYRPPGGACGLHELLRPSVIQALGNALLAAQLSDAVVAAQAFEHYADLVLGREVPTGLLPDVLHHLLCSAIGRSNPL